MAQDNGFHILCLISAQTGYISFQPNQKSDALADDFHIGSGVRIFQVWQGQKDLNPRPTVLETAALPTELYPFMDRREERGGRRDRISTDGSTLSDRALP